MNVAFLYMASNLSEMASNLCRQNENGESLRNAGIKEFLMTHQIGDLVSINTTMNAHKYTDTTKGNLKVTGLRIGLKEVFILQQENDPRHTAKESKKVLQDPNIQLLKLLSTRFQVIQLATCGIHWMLRLHWIRDMIEYIW